MASIPRFDSHCQRRASPARNAELPLEDVDGCMAVQSRIAIVSEVSAVAARGFAPDSQEDRNVDCALQH